MFYMFPRIVRPEVCDKIIEDCISNDLEKAQVYDGGSDGGVDSSRDDPDIRKTSIYWVPTKVSSKANDLAWYFLKQIVFLGIQDELQNPAHVVVTIVGKAVLG